MSSELQVFSYNGAEIRITDIDGVPYFVGKDIATVLGYKNTRDALIQHVDEEDKRESRITTPSNSGYANMTVINESGLYSLIFASKLPEAKKFKHWVTHEVLPSIRKHGMYLTDQALDAMKNDPEAFERVLKMYAESREENSALRKELDDSRPFTNLGRIVLSLPGSIPMQSAAQFLAQHGFAVGLIRLFRFCREKKLLCSRKGRQHNMPTQKSIELGLFSLEISGGFKASLQITPKGLSRVTELLVKENYPLLLMMEDEGE